jgi:hypothetical protein
MSGEEVKTVKVRVDTIRQPTEKVEVPVPEGGWTLKWNRISALARAEILAWTRRFNAFGFELDAEQMDAEQMDAEQTVWATVAFESLADAGRIVITANIPDDLRGCSCLRIMCVKKTEDWDGGVPGHSENDGREPHNIYRWGCLL